MSLKSNKEHDLYKFQTCIIDIAPSGWTRINTLSPAVADGSFLNVDTMKVGQIPTQMHFFLCG